jgi:hypothetical protein
MAGDGTTSVVLLAGEFLRQAKTFLDDGVHPRIIIRGFRKGAELALERVRALSETIQREDTGPQARRALLERCAKTALNSKLISGQKEFFAPMVVDAIELLDPKELDLGMIGIKKVPGGSVTDSMLVAGVAFKRTFSYAGFEQQPKQFNSPAIALLNVELELKSEKENAEIRIEDPSEVSIFSFLCISVLFVLMRFVLFFSSVSLSFLSIFFFFSCFFQQDLFLFIIFLKKRISLKFHQKSTAKSSTPNGKSSTANSTKSFNPAPKSCFPNFPSAISPLNTLPTAKSFAPVACPKPISTASPQPPVASSKPPSKTSTTTFSAIVTILKKNKSAANVSTFSKAAKLLIHARSSSAVALSNSWKKPNGHSMMLS